MLVFYGLFEYKGALTGTGTVIWIVTLSASTISDEPMGDKQLNVVDRRSRGACAGEFQHLFITVDHLAIPCPCSRAFYARLVIDAVIDVHFHGFTPRACSCVARRAINRGFRCTLKKLSIGVEPDEDEDGRRRAFTCTRVKTDAHTAETVVRSRTASLLRALAWVNLRVCHRALVQRSQLAE